MKTVGIIEMNLKKNKKLTSDKNINMELIFTSQMDFQAIDYWEYCDNCGGKLIIRKCEFICERCGFFHSCSEP
jgi:hypothetical protein